MHEEGRNFHACLRVLASFRSSQVSDISTMMHFTGLAYPVSRLVIDQLFPPLLVLDQHQASVVQELGCHHITTERTRLSQAAEISSYRQISLGCSEVATSTRNPSSQLFYIERRNKAPCISRKLLEKFSLETILRCRIFSSIGVSSEAYFHTR